MCLAVPSRVAKIEENEIAEVEVGGIKKKASLALLADVKIGDYVLVHAGFAIQVVDEKEAKETLKILKEMSEIGGVYQ